VYLTGLFRQGFNLGKATKNWSKFEDMLEVIKSYDEEYEFIPLVFLLKMKALNMLSQKQGEDKDDYAEKAEYMALFIYNQYGARINTALEAAHVLVGTQREKVALNILNRYKNKKLDKRDLILMIDLAFDLSRDNDVILLYKRFIMNYGDIVAPVDFKKIIYTYIKLDQIKDAKILHQKAINRFGEERFPSYDYIKLYGVRAIVDKSSSSLRPEGGIDLKEFEVKVGGDGALSSRAPRSVAEGSQRGSLQFPAVVGDDDAESNVIPSVAEGSQHDNALSIDPSRIQGFRIRILNITPINNVPAFLGLLPDDDSSSQAEMAYHLKHDQWARFEPKIA